MAAKTMNISLTPELKASIIRRVRSGLYGNSSDVIRAGLRALAREEARDGLEEFERAMADLPQDQTTPEVEQDIERSIRAARKAERPRTGRKKNGRE